MRAWTGCVVLVGLSACGNVTARPDTGGGGLDDALPIDGRGASGSCSPSACASGYCDPATEMCLPEARAIYVDPNGADSATCGDKATPCRMLGGLTGGLAKVGPVRNVVILAAGTYAEALKLAVPMTIYGPAATVVPPTAGITLNITGATTDVRLERVTIESAAAGDANSHAVYCSGATARLVDVTVRNAKGLGMYSDGCKLLQAVRGTIEDGARGALGTEALPAKITVDGTLVTGNLGGLGAFGANVELAVTGATVIHNTGVAISAGGGAVLTLERSLIQDNTFGISIAEAAFTIRNNMVVENGVATNAFGGVALKNTNDRAPEIFEFNTVANNAGGTLARNLSCQATANTPILITNSIAFGGSGAAPSYSTATPTSCSVTYSNVEGGVAGTGNLNAAPTYRAAGDYHLTPTSAGVSAANPSATLAVDFDGETRPFGPGRDMGADEVH